MRLRRETGDFSIVPDQLKGGWQPIQKGLSEEDFIGAVVRTDSGDLCICNRARRLGETITLYLSDGSSQLLYNIETGEFRNDSDDEH